MDDEAMSARGLEDDDDMVIDDVEDDRPVDYESLAMISHLETVVTGTEGGCETWDVVDTRTGLVVGSGFSTPYRPYEPPLLRYAERLDTESWGGKPW